MSCKTPLQYFMPLVQSVAWTETARARVLATRVERNFMIVGGRFDLGVLV